MKIGVLAYRFDYYTNKRIIVGKVPEFKYQKVHDLYSIERNLAFRLNRLAGKPLIPAFNLNNQFDDFDLNRVDLFHFSNGISYGRTPWVSSFETILPRFSDLVTRHQGSQIVKSELTALVKKGLNALAGNACKRIIAWSDCAALMQKDLLGDFPSDYGKPILEKMEVIHPPQEILVDEIEPKRYDKQNPIRFVLVGAAFFRKGGRELLQVFEKLAKQEGLPVKLVVVSSLRMEPYAANETEADVAWAKQALNANPDWVEYYPSLSNADVLKLMRSCDIGLLPTWADTYGLSVLEAQACGLPVISTDIRALPEMNNEQVGWMIPVPKNRLGEALYLTEEERRQTSEAISHGLEKSIRQIVDQPELIAQKATMGLERLREKHDPLDYSNKLRRIYREAIS